MIYWEARSSYQVFWQIFFLYIICMYLIFKAHLNFVCITCVPHLLLYSFYVVAVVVEVCLPPPLLMKMHSLSHCQLMNNVQVHEHVVGKLMYTCAYCTIESWEISDWYYILLTTFLYYYIGNMYEISQEIHLLCVTFHIHVALMSTSIHDFYCALYLYMYMCLL